MKTKENQEKISSSIEAEDHVSSKIKDSSFYLDLALEQYKITREFIEKKKKMPSNLAFYMSETCTWLCGLHIGYLKRDHDLFRYN